MSKVSSVEIKILGDDLVGLGKKLDSILDEIRSSSSRIREYIQILKGYNGSLSNDVYIDKSDNKQKHKKWIVNVSGGNINNIDFDGIQTKIDLLTHESSELDEVSQKLDIMLNRIEELLGEDSVKYYLFGNLGRYCKINKDTSYVTSLHPELEKKKEELIKKCKEIGIKIKITDTTRTIEEQQELYNKGRTTDGEIVTNAKGTDYGSNHQWGIAFDVCIRKYKDKDGKWKKCEGDEEKFNDDILKKVGELGKSLGLEWGGDWKEFTDTSHFQLKGYDNLNETYNEPAEFVKTWGYN